ncbi:MAG: hypothetical protein WBB28_24745 [Crinalium sp.]
MVDALILLSLVWRRDAAKVSGFGGRNGDRALAVFLFFNSESIRFWGEKWRSRFSCIFIF